MKRTALHAADLYVLIQKEFRRRQTPECQVCFVQLPYRVDRSNSHDANWEVALPSSDCPHGCLVVIEELIQEFQALYDLAPDTGQG